MQNATRNLGLAVAAVLTTSVLDAAQDQAPKGNLVQQLRAAYRLAVMDTTGIKVTQSGTTLVVKKEGIQANPPNLGYYGNDYEDGQVTASAVSSAADRVKAEVKDKIKLPFGRSKVDKKVDSVALAVDDKVYLLKMDIKPASVDLYVQSCGTCDPAAADPAHHPHLAEVSVHLVKGFLNTSNFSQVQQVIDGILALPDANAGADQSVQAQPSKQEAPAAPAPAPAPEPAPPQPQFAPIAPPEAPPAEPAQLGDTTEQVIAKLGKPNNTVNAGTKEIYIYKDLKVKVTFVKGKVTAVE
jgi:hypothetical protein